MSKATPTRPRRPLALQIDVGDALVYRRSGIIPDRLKHVVAHALDRMGPLEWREMELMWREYEEAREQQR